MQTIDLYDLNFDREFNKAHSLSGSFGKIYKCEFDGKVYALKDFFDGKYLDGKIRKLNELSKINEPFLNTPKYWVKNGKRKLYLTEFVTGKGFYDVQSLSLKEKIKLLNDLKEKIIIMHSYGIIHGDLINTNILYNNESSTIIDFDNSSFGKYSLNAKDTNENSLNFIEKYGIKKEMDIHLFNILAFSIINDTSYPITNILRQNYGHFSDNEAKKICNSALLLEKYPNKDFLIDTIKETKI